MPSLPKRKEGIVACSGEEMAQGMVTRQAALKVLEQLRPDETVTICLPLFLAGGEGDRAFAKFYPTIAVDGCEKRCAARGTELYSNKPAASIVVDDLVAQHNLPQPQGVRRLTAESQTVVDALADAIAHEVDVLMQLRWSRSEGTILDAGPSTSSVTTAACACGSGIPVTSVQLGDLTVQIVALEPIMELAYSQGLRADGELPSQILQTVQVYNPVPADDEAGYAQAVRLAWRAYCDERGRSEREGRQNG
jgi:uncharacterized metal-binding protein